MAAPHSNTRTNTSNNPSTNCGISLVELMVGLTIVAVLMALSSAGLPKLVKKQQVQAAAEQFFSVLQYARHTAIVQGRNVILCPLNRTQADRCGARNTWHHGALLFADDNNNLKIDGEERILRTLAHNKTLKIYWRAFRYRAYLKFRPSGMTDWQNGHFLFCPNSGEAHLARQIVLNYAGRAYLSDDADQDGVHEDAHGKPLACPRHVQASAGSSTLMMATSKVISAPLNGWLKSTFTVLS